MTKLPRDPYGDVSLVLCGAAGQGVQTVEDLLVHVLKRSGFHVFASREYMSRVRGGNNSTEIRIGSKPVRALVDRIDILLALNGGIRTNITERLDARTLILADGSEMGDEVAGLGGDFVDVPLLSMAKEAGGAVYAGSAAAGIVAGLFGVDTSLLNGFYEKRFGGAVAEGNKKAAGKGMNIASAMERKGRLSVVMKPPTESGDRMILNGSEAVSIGAVTGGCSFIASYPMSPATGVLTFMAKHSHDFKIGVEQAEDEIAAINMALGASFGGARSMVSTSGGGLSLMAEGISLSGIAEIPVVLHIGQRPGPGTGMATRTEQGDLNAAVYAGHGEFPRIVYAPGSLEEAFNLTFRAFDMAEKYHIPVFVLTDQYFLNSFYDLPLFDLSGCQTQKHIVRSDADYRRYALSSDGVSSRSVPGYGSGTVGTDSHEHEEDGHVKEDFHLRVSMSNKRLKKAEGILGESVPPVLTGPTDFETLVIGWGSTRHIVEDVLASMERPGVAHLHFPQVYPLPPETHDMLDRAERTIFVEGNATGQFEGLVRRETGRGGSERVLHYSGLQISVEILRSELEALLAKRG